MGVLFEVIGVMPATFRGMAPPGFLTDVWFPVEDIAKNTLLRDRAATRFEVAVETLEVTHVEAAAALRVVAEVRYESSIRSCASPSRNRSLPRGWDLALSAE